MDPHCGLDQWRGKGGSDPFEGGSGALEGLRPRAGGLHKRAQTYRGLRPLVGPGKLGTSGVLRRGEGTDLLGGFKPTEGLRPTGG